MSFPVTNGVTTFIPPPDGYEVNFDKPQQQNVVDHYFIFGVLGSVALVCLTQRLYTKQALAGGLQVDDGQSPFLHQAPWFSSGTNQWHLQS